MRLQNKKFIITHTTNNIRFTRLKHYIEKGALVMNKKMHLNKQF